MSRIITSKEFYTHPPCHVVVHRDMSVYSSPTEPNDLDLCHDDLDCKPDEMFSFHPFFFRKNLDVYPQFAFIPINGQFLGPLLSRLARYSVIKLPNGRWGLEPAILASWVWLEDTLSVAISCLSQGVLLPMRVNFYSYPQELGYRKTYLGHRRAVASIKQSRESFLVLLGLFSMFYSFRAERHLYFSTHPLTNKQPSVQFLLKNGTSLSDSIIQDLIDMHSVLGPRLGFVNEGCDWFEQYQFALAYAGVRYWIYWGKASPSLIPRLQYQLRGSHLLKYLPKHEAVGRCLHFLSQNDYPSVVMSQLVSVDKKQAVEDVLPAISSSDPQPVSNTNEKQAYTPQEFLLHRAKLERSRGEKASPAELLRWESRQKVASINRLARKSKVYHWQDVGGVRRRTYVERSHAADVWEYRADLSTRTNGQRKYSAVFDEWDVCTDFDPSEQPQAPDEYDYEEDDAYVPPISYNHPLPPAAEPPPPSSQSSQPHIVPNCLAKLLHPDPLPPTHNEQGLLFAHSLGVDDEEIITPQLDAVMYERYGIDVEDMSSDILAHAFSPHPNPLTLEQVSRILMEKNAIASSSFEAAIRDVVTLVDQGLPIPDKYWDLKNSQLRHSDLGYFRFLLLKLTSLDSDAVLQGYTVTPVNARYLRPWVLLFESAIAVTQCIRERWGPSLEDVVCKACQRGYRIHVFIMKNARDLLPRASPPSLFSRRVREEGFFPSHFDFHAYQSVVDILVMQPRLRAAVLRGGILGRICTPYISLDDVAQGPSDDVLRYGMRWQAADPSILFVEDFISEEEVQLLCGFWFVDTSRTSGRAGQFRSFSFFPTPDIWEKSGIHTGFWSNSAEQKFRSIMAKLAPLAGQNPSPQPTPVPFKSTTEWKSNLRLHVKKTKNFIGYVEETAARFILSL